MQQLTPCVGNAKIIKEEKWEETHVAEEPLCSAVTTSEKQDEKTDKRHQQLKTQ